MSDRFTPSRPGLTLAFTKPGESPAFSLCGLDTPATFTGIVLPYLAVIAPMDKRYQVFVSSTFADLQEERQAVMQALLLRAFRSKVETGRHVKFWANADDLRAKVIQSISAETKRNPQEGWVRAGRVADPALLEGLRKEIDDLRAELAAAKSEAPTGAENYAGGTNEFEVRYMSRVFDGQRWENGSHKVKVTWNTIFFEIGPILMEEAPEQQMKKRLSDEVWRYDFFEFPNGSLNSIADESFDTIKIQLFALGLIQKSPKKHVPSDTNRYWSLTPYGETMLMKLRAIPKADGAFLLEKSPELKEANSELDSGAQQAQGASD